MANTSSSSSGGIGFAGLLTIIFITLKLCHVIDWTWTWVLSPIWISAILAVLILGGCLVFAWISVNREERRLAERRKDRF